MSVLAAFTDWLNDWGPIAWGIAFFGGALAASGAYGIAGWGYGKWVSYKAARDAADRGRANPLHVNFSREFVSLPDFYDREYVPHKKKTFSDCRVSGPGMVFFLKFVSMIRCDLRHVQVVILPDKEMNLFGVTVFEECDFRDCILSNFTILMERSQYDALSDELRANIQVINAGNLS